ncbi:PAQR family membrane homeostasis protein TrhA [Paenibacillus taiwanensis]|uniref:PAQR family membrane homeostasis protein TrhA n=1 Tax=Paenibacillus taiwanensis TaxID=401638 RepID=UPI0003FFFFAD|nr:hemolysin III family protein [Paenibacillus taiwanensis]
MTSNRAQREEWANTWTHGWGLVLSIVASIALFIKVGSSGTAGQLVGAFAYTFSLMLMFTTSCLMHRLPEGTKKERYIMYDHMAIYICIAGTYTPFLLLKIGTFASAALLIAIWIVTIAGVVWKRYYTGRFILLSTLIYLVMGWSVVFIWDHLAVALSIEGVRWLLSGGIAYTIGIIFFLWRALVYHHAIWHVLIVIGAACHYVCMWKYVFT